MSLPLPRNVGATDRLPMRLSAENRLTEHERTNDYLLTIVWVCIGCGFYHREEDAPARCPRCMGERILSALGVPRDEQTF